MPLVMTDEIDVYYESHGEGPALVLLHGGGNHAAWWQQIPHFSKGYRVLTIDLPGFGLSKVKNGVYDTSVHPGAIEAVLDDAGIDRAFLVSQSLGGYGMLKYATTHTDRVAGVIMTSTLGPIGDEISDLHKVGRASVAHLSVADFLLTKEFQEKQPAKVGLFFQVGSFNETGPGRPVRPRNALMGSVSVRDLRDAIGAGPHVSILEGGADVMVHPPAYARLRELLPEANVQLVEGAPHSEYGENPDRFNAVVDEILLAAAARRPRIGLSVLGEELGAACRTLAGPHEARFRGLAWDVVGDGAILIGGAAAWFDCSVAGTVPAGDHVLALLRVHGIAYEKRIGPLIFHGSRFRRLDRVGS